MLTGVQVAVDNAAFQFDKLYSYNVPEALQPYAKIGCRVLVPFGKGKHRPGIILGECAPSDAFKSILDVERTSPILDDEMLDLIHTLKETTFCTYYDAVKAVLPKNMRLVPDSEYENLELESRGHAMDVFVATGRRDERVTAKQEQLLNFLQTPQPYSSIKEELGFGREMVYRLEERGLVERREEIRSMPLDFRMDVRGEAAAQLTEAQSQALKEIQQQMNSGPGKTTLLYGVTSSGKTLLYVHLIQEVLKQGKGALMLVPEIALATQMIGRLQQLFPNQVGILHSGLSDSERAVQWNRIRQGEFPVVIGTRSAVFAPIPSIGLIIVDEEQEGSYQSDQSPRYRAVNVAAKRVRTHGAHLLLSSATPSVETYHLAMEGKIGYVALHQRYGDMPLPKVTVTDMRAQLMQGNTGSVSQELYDKIQDRLQRGEQCILLLNRRGYRTVTICKECKEVLMCPDCSMPMVWHKADGTHRCHYCGRSIPQVIHCPKCGGEVRHTGIGTQKIEEELELLFPTARILRVDLDAMSRKGTMVQALRDFQNKKYDIMVGTQMIAKGLDFENVTLVGVLSVDAMLLMPSYRAFERTFDMLTQVIGRAGRGSKEGEAVIQTIDPGNPIISLAAQQDYDAFYRNEIQLRKAHLYPPFCTMYSLVFAAASHTEGHNTARAFIRRLATEMDKRPQLPIRVLGPSPMRVPVVGRQYRWRVLLKGRRDRVYFEILRDVLDTMNQEKEIGKTRISVTVGTESDS